ncbi:MAG: zinc-binding dehydrogenase [Burkholderiales bacterium]|nr:zinc-binding dehydrogenase [Anaerolineae bacterium]
MRASVLTEHGSRDVLRVVDDMPVPEPGPNQVRIAMKAAALNRLDLWVREGWPGLKLHMPHITTADGAGIVEAVGPSVTNVTVGDRVGINPTLVDEDCLALTGSEEDCLDIKILGEHAPGVAAEYVVLPARNLITLPPHISFAEAAAVGLVYVTAWHSLLNRGNLKAGESVLIVGAGGGVNSASIQIAKLCGCKVYVVGSSTEKCRQAEELGADVTINREQTPDWSKAMFQLTNKRGVDVVVDNVGQATLQSSIRSVKRGGRILIVGNTSGPKFELDVRFIFGKQISLIGSTMGPTSAFVRVMNLVFDGKLKPIISAALPLADVKEGHRLLEEGDVFGKIVLEI